MALIEAFDAGIRQRINEAAGGVGQSFGGQRVAAARGGTGKVYGENVRPSSGTPQGFDGELGAFMAAIRKQESGGRYTILGPQTKYGRPRGAYQILDSNWEAWAREAGVPGADWRDPKAQDTVAKYKMMQYYRQFGSWQAVAVAWFAGPGRAKDYVVNPSSVINLEDVLGTAVGKYVQMATNGMNEILGSQIANPPTGVTYGPSQSWDAQSVGEVGKMLAEHFGLEITSHVRSEEHNSSIGGAKSSDHLWGGGIDFGGSHEQMMALAKYLEPFTGPNGPLRLVLNPDEHPHGTGPHVHVSFRRDNNAPLVLPGGEQFGPSVQVGEPTMLDVAQPDQRSSVTALVAGVRGALGNMLMGPGYNPQASLDEGGAEPAEDVVRRGQRAKGVLA